MIDYKKEYKIAIRQLIIIIILALIIFVQSNYTVAKTNKKLQEKEEQVWQLETEIVELKEQIDILSNSKESEEDKNE